MFSTKSSQLIKVKNQVDHFYKVFQKVPIIKDYKLFTDLYNNQIFGKRVPKLSFNNYIEVYRNILINREYCVLLMDESIISMVYQFDINGNISYHCLTYIPSVPLEVNINDSEVNDEEKVILIKELSKYIRFDYEPLVFKPVIHSNVHMHVGIHDRDKDSDSKNIRFTFEGIIFPNDFLYFVFKYIYCLDDEQIDPLNYDVDKKTCLLDPFEESKFVFSYNRHLYSLD